MEQMKIMQHNYAGTDLLLEDQFLYLFCIELFLLVMFLPDRRGSQKRIMNLDSSLMKTSNMSKLISIPIFTLRSKNYIIFMIIITKIILAMPERDY